MRTNRSCWGATESDCQGSLPDCQAIADENEHNEQRGDRRVAGERQGHTDGSAARDALFLSGDWFIPRGLYCDWAGIGGDVE